MENENTDQTTADQEVPQPKKMSAKECVQQRLAGLASGAIQPVKRGPGRPRIHPEGYKKPSRVDPSNPRSIAAQAGGLKTQANRQSIIQTEASRKKWGRIRQDELNQQLAELDQEMQGYSWGPGLDQSDTKEFVKICARLISDFIWQRKYPAQKDDMWDEFEAPIEERKFTSGWPDYYMRDLLTMSRYVLAPERLGVRKLVVETATRFLEWAKDQINRDSAFEQTVEQVTKSLPKLESGSIFKGFILPENDPRLDPPTSPRPIEEILAERRQWELQGRDTSVLSRAESLQEEKLRLDREMEAAIIEQKAEDARRALEQQQRALLGNQFNDIRKYLDGEDGSVFGSSPTRR